MNGLMLTEALFLGVFFGFLHQDSIKKHLKHHMGHSIRFFILPFRG